MKLTFIENPTFMGQIDKLGKPLSDEVLSAIENDLLKNVERGAIVPGTNGARKARISDPGRQKGKRGGFRYIYIYFEAFARVYLLLFYGKDVKDDLSKAEKKIIADSIKKAKETLKRGN
jgi:mRNA-degrading endonuclease RelE of RelBE toxin-antitoxin system